MGRAVYEPPFPFLATELSKLVQQFPVIHEVLPRDVGRDGVIAAGDVGILLNTLQNSKMMS